MSFGLSISDFITAIELANRIRKTFVDAPSQFKNISDEVRSLSIVLQDVEVVLSERELTSQQKTELHDIADGCHRVLDELERILDKYRELSSGLEDARKKVKRVWKRLKWEPEDIRELRSRICSNITLFNAFNGQLIRDNTVKLVRHKDDQERRTILDWLTPTDYGTQQSDFISRRQEGTGQWLLDLDKFQAWLNTSKQTLFCPGIPGAGKTTITSIIVEHLQNNFRNDVSIGIAYLYCNFRRQQEQKPADLLASVLKQLIQRRPSVPESITTLYKRHNDERTRPSFDEISKVLHSVVADYSQTFIIIDALDECQVSNKGRQRILAGISNLQTKTRANLFATSRFIPEIMKEFEGSVPLEIRASSKDVQRYLDGHMSRLPSFVLRSPDLQEEIKTEIMKAVDGMFLLAQLHLDSLIGKKSPKAIRSTLKTLSTGSGAYDRAYKEAMERIEGQIADSHKLATQVLLWITCAKRPLTTLELRHALAIEVGELTFDKENLSEIEDMVSVCAGLVTVNEKSDIIRLIHYITQEYFERTWITWFPDAQRNIAMNCVTYLSFDVFKTGFCRTDKEFETRLQLYPLYDYAARNWGYHARAALAEVEQFILDFLNSAAKISGSSQAMMAFKDFGYHGYSQEVPRQLSGVHLAAYFGLREVIIALLKHGDGPNVKDTYGQTPLSWAAANGRGTVVKLLLANHDVDPECKDKYDQTPLSRAAEYGREEVVKLLLVKDRVNLNSKDSLYGRTPLAWAAESGHDRMVKLLLATDGVDPDSKNTDGETPLLLTARNGHEAAVKLLLTKDGVDFNTKDKKHGRTPLSCAAENGHEVVVKLLLAKNGVDSNSKDTGYGRTPLSWAAANGHEAVVKLLLATDNVNLNPKDNNIRTPLWWAAKNGHEGVMKLLLAKDAVKPDSKDIDGRTPLSWAVKNGHEEMVKLLLATDSVDPDSKDKYGWTPLSWAAMNGHEAVVRLLLAKVAVDPDSKDNDDRTPLSKAAWKGHEAVVKLLLATNSVDPDSQATNYGLTPLWWAVWNGHEEVVTMLLATDGVDPDSKETEYGRTPLSLAAANGAEAVVRLLLTNVAVDPDFKDKHGRSPLCWASRHGHKAVVELLLAKDGVDPDSKDNNGRTPLLLAAQYGHERVVRLLLTKDGVDVNSKDKDGRTPLLLAAAKKREQWMRNSEYEIVVELLLASNCVDVNTKDTSGRTPLSWAAGEGHYARVKLLLAKNGIDPDSKDDLGQTPLWWATKNGHQSVIKMLAARPLDS